MSRSTSTTKQDRPRPGQHSPKSFPQRSPLPQHAINRTISKYKLIKSKLYKHYLKNIKPLHRSIRFPEAGSAAGAAKVCILIMQVKIKRIKKKL